MARKYAPNRIKEVREMRGLSQEALGAALPSDLTGSTIAKLEGGRMALALDYLVDIARVLQVDISDLVPGGGAGVRMAPVIGIVAAGNWREAVQMSGESLPIPRNLEGKNLFVLRVAGDSMDRLILDGSAEGFVVVNPDDRELRDKKFYVIQNGDHDATFKQFQANPLALLPCSTNPDHKPIPLGEQPFTVIGRVVYAGQEM